MVNGVHGPAMPQVNGLALTEYSVNITPPSERVTKPIASTQVPDAFLLPDGYPDVRLCYARRCIG